MKLRTRSTSSSNNDTIATWIACFDGIIRLAIIMRLERGKGKGVGILKVLALEVYGFICVSASFGDFVVEVFQSRLFS